MASSERAARMGKFQRERERGGAGPGLLGASVAAATGPRGLTPAHQHKEVRKRYTLQAHKRTPERQRAASALRCTKGRSCTPRRTEILGPAKMTAEKNDRTRGVYRPTMPVNVINRPGIINLKHILMGVHQNRRHRSCGSALSVTAHLGRTVSVITGAGVLYQRA